jgi:predicted phosphoribosyltransferase
LIIDGIATGATLKAGIRAVKQMGAGKTIAVSPVGPEDSVEEISQIADDVICPYRPEDFHAVGNNLKFNLVGLWYESFPQTSDQEVIELLNKKFKEE